MDKQQVLKDYKKQEDKICLSQVLDKIEFSKTREKIEYTDFLDMYQVSLVENFLRKINFKTYQLYGGYEEAERKVLLVYPEKYDEKMIAKNYDKILKIVRVILPEEEKGKYSHRNYLGGIVKLGLKREKVEQVKIIVPSLRLDNFVSDLARTSRSKAVQIIEQERVFVNGQNEKKASKQVKINDIITIRGKGRFVIKGFDGTTRSGRTVVVVEKYV